MAWKNTIAVFQTSGAPPSSGSTILVNSGWIQNSSAAPANTVAVNNAACAVWGDAWLGIVRRTGGLAIR